MPSVAGSRAAFQARPGQAPLTAADVARVARDRAAIAALAPEVIAREHDGVWDVGLVPRFGRMKRRPKHPFRHPTLRHAPVGDERRMRIHRLTRRLVGEARGLGFEVDNEGDFPIVGVVIGTWEQMMTACRTLWEHDILITPATFPAVPINRNLVRFSVTAANTDAEVSQAVAALAAVRRGLQSGPESRVAALAEAVTG